MAKPTVLHDRKRNKKRAANKADVIVMTKQHIRKKHTFLYAQNGIERADVELASELLRRIHYGIDGGTTRVFRELTSSTAGTEWPNINLLFALSSFPCLGIKDAFAARLTNYPSYRVPV